MCFSNRWGQSPPSELTCIVTTTFWCLPWRECWHGSGKKLKMLLFIVRGPVINAGPGATGWGMITQVWGDPDSRNLQICGEHVSIHICFFLWITSVFVWCHFQLLIPLPISPWFLPCLFLSFLFVWYEEPPVSPMVWLDWADTLDGACELNQVYTTF